MYGTLGDFAVEKPQKKFMCRSFQNICRSAKLYTDLYRYIYPATVGTTLNGILTVSSRQSATDG